MRLEAINERIKEIGIKRAVLADMLCMNYNSLSMILTAMRPLKDSTAAHIELLLDKLEAEQAQAREVCKPRSVTFVFTVELPAECCRAMESSMEGLTAEEREHVVQAMAQKALERLRAEGENALRGVRLT